MLDRETVRRIEELHAVVLQTEAAQRFGLFRGKKSAEFADAEAAELAFLNEQGFASYTDFRLRIRRSGIESTAAPALAPPPAAPPQPARLADDGNVAMLDIADPPGPGRPDDRGNLPPMEPEQPAREHPRQLTAAPSDFAAVVQAYDVFCTRLGAEMDEFVHARLELAERDASEAFDTAAQEAAQLLNRTQALHAATALLIQELGRRGRDVVVAADAALGQLDALRTGLAGRDAAR